MSHRRNFLAATRTILLTLVAACTMAREQRQAASTAESGQLQWFKGNLHTHSLWSDGDDYPEMIADWFKGHGYHFLAISDHNVMQEGPRWFELKGPVSFKGEVVELGGGPTLEKYLRRFGADWVERREADGKKQVRLKPLDEYRALLEEPGRFLMISSEEISASWTRAKTATEPAKGGPVHINVTNVRDVIAPINGDNALDVMQRTIDAVVAQREKTGQPMFSHINHPNWGWGITAEELMQVRRERFFEVYNGHPGVKNKGDATHLDMDRMWDVVLTRRLAELGLEAMYGIAVDDSHHYHKLALGKCNPGRGWVMVRAKHLTAESLIHSMEAGNFYSTSGVVLVDVQREGNRLAVEIQAEPGVSYATQFIGTRKGYDASSEVIPPADATAARGVAHRRYSKDVGAVLKEVKGTSAAYTLKGDEIYVRAKIVSSKPKENGSVAGEFETAWTQPLVNASR